MLLFNPKLHNRKYTDEKTRDLMQKTIDFLENKGLKNLKKDWHDKVWNHDFVEFMKENQIFATLMTPAGYGEDDSMDFGDALYISIFSNQFGGHP